MFQIKTFDGMVASMINNAQAISPELTDFNTGSTTRTLLEAVARELDGFYQGLLKGLHDAIPVAIYRTFNFGRLPAAKATGTVTFTRTAGSTGVVTIPAGTRVMVSDLELVFSVVGEVSISSGGNTVDATVMAVVEGPQGNISAGTLTTIVDAVSKLGSVTNALDFITGSDLETDIERKNRFQRWVSSLSRATREAVEYGATTAVLMDGNGAITERVVSSVVHEPCIDEDPAGDAGVIEIYIWNGVDGASAELITEAKRIVDGYTDDNGVRVPGYKGAGIIAHVYAIETDAVDVTCTIDLEAGFVFADVETAVEEAVEAYFSGLAIGYPVIWAKLNAAIAGVAGVADVTLVSPAANEDPTDSFHVCTPGTVTITDGAAV